LQLFFCEPYSSAKPLSTAALTHALGVAASLITRLRHPKLSRERTMQVRGAPVADSQTQAGVHGGFPQTTSPKPVADRDPVTTPRSARRRCRPTRHHVGAYSTAPRRGGGPIRSARARPRTSAKGLQELWRAIDVALPAHAPCCATGSRRVSHRVPTQRLRCSSWRSLDRDRRSASATVSHPVRKPGAPSAFDTDAPVTIRGSSPAKLSIAESAP
jgi:hypothetical protein